jgi:hypothetical protein
VAVDYPVCIKDDTSLKDGIVEVKFKPISGKEDQAGGLIWRARDANNYYIARANALEDNVTIYHTVNGRRSEKKRTNMKVATGEWHTLRVDFQGNHFTVEFDGKKAIDWTDDTFKEAGKVGVWTKADSVTLFDDFTYESHKTWRSADIREVLFTFQDLPKNNAPGIMAGRNVTLVQNREHMPAGTVALRLIRRAFHQLDVALTRWIAPLPKDTSHADPADLVGFRTFFRRLPSDAAARDYMHVHLPRLVRTMTLVPKPAGVRRALELGSYMQMSRPCMPFVDIRKFVALTSGSLAAPCASLSRSPAENSPAISISSTPSATGFPIRMAIFH